MTQPPPPRRQRLTRLQLSALLAIFVIAAYFRLDQIAGPSLWMDELWSIEMAMGHGSVHDNLPIGVIQHEQTEITNLAAAAPSWAIFTHVNGVTHPPLFYVVLRWWMDAFGTSPASVRALSTLFSLAEIVVLFDICRFLHPTNLALLAAGLTAVAVMQIEIAQDGRSYTLVSFFALCAADAVVRIQFLGANLRRLLAIVFFAFASAITHYLCVGAILAVAVYALIRLQKRDRTKALVAFCMAGILCLAAWIPLLISQKRTLGTLAPTFVLEARIADHLKLTIFRIIGLPAEFLLGGAGGDQSARANPNLVLGIFCFALVVPLLRLMKRNNPLLWILWALGAAAFVAAVFATTPPGYARDIIALSPAVFGVVIAGDSLFHFLKRSDLALWVLWSLGTIGFVVATDLLHTTTLVGYPRYTVLASPAIYVIIAAFDWPRVRILRHLVAIVFIAAAVTAAINRSLAPVAAKNDWRQLADDLNSAAGPDDLLVFSNPDPWVSSGTWYLGLRYYTPSFHHPWLILNSSPDRDLLEQLRSRDHVWLIGIAPRVLAPRLLPGFEPDLEIKTSAGIADRFVPERAKSQQPDRSGQTPGNAEGPGRAE